MENLSIIAFILLFIISAGCGTNSKEKAQKEMAITDSINKAAKEKKLEDSIFLVEQVKQDSILKVLSLEDSLSKVKAKNNSKKTTIKKPTNKQINKKSIKQAAKKPISKKK